MEIEHLIRPPPGCSRIPSTTARRFSVKALRQQGPGRRIVSFWRAHGPHRVSRAGAACPEGSRRSVTPKRPFRYASLHHALL